jgi:hypothetical protein
MYSCFINKENKFLETLVFIFWKKFIKKKLNHIIKIFLIAKSIIKEINIKIFKLRSKLTGPNLKKFIFSSLLRKIILNIGIILANEITSNMVVSKVPKKIIIKNFISFFVKR